MTTIDIGEAATQLPQLIERALAGEGIVIARDGHPGVQLVPRRAESPQMKPRVGGQLEGEMWISSDFDAPLFEEVAPTNPKAPTDEPLRKRQVAGQLRGDPWLTSIDLDAPLDEEVARAFGMLDE